MNTVLIRKLALALSISYIVYNLLIVLINLVYKNYIVYRERLESIEKEAPLAYGKNVEKKGIQIDASLEEKIQEELLQAGIHLRTEEYLKIRAVITALPFLIILIIKNDMVLAIGGALFGFIAPPLHLKKKKKDRMDLFNDQLGDVILIISNSLRAGFTFEQAMGSVARDLPDPIGPEFLKIGREVELGERLEVAMEDTARRMGSEDMELMNTAVAIQRQVGGNLADVLDNIGTTIRDRIIIKKKIKAMTAQGEISGKIIGFLPFALLIIVSLVNKEYMEPLFTTTFGKILLIISIILEGLGFMTIKKIVNIEV